MPFRSQQLNFLLRNHAVCAVPHKEVKSEIPAPLVKQLPAADTHFLCNRTNDDLSSSGGQWKNQNVLGCWSTPHCVRMGCLHCGWEQLSGLCRRTFWKIPLGPTLAVAFLTPRTSNTEPSVRKSRILCFSGEACDNVQCMYTEGTVGQKQLLGSPRGKTGFVMIIFLIYFIKLVESEHYMKCR